MFHPRSPLIKYNAPKNLTPEFGNCLGVGIFFTHLGGYHGRENENGSQVLALQALASLGLMPAERTGFEPADQFPGHRFSKPTLSTTQPPLLTSYLLTSYIDQSVAIKFALYKIFIASVFL